MYTQSSIDKSRLDKSKVDVIKHNQVENNKKDMQQQPHAAVYDNLEKIFPGASTMWVVAIDKYLDRLSDELIINAIQETASSGINNPKYFKAICERYILNGYKNLKDIKNQNAKQTKKALDREEYNKKFIEMAKKQSEKKLINSS